MMNGQYDGLTPEAMQAVMNTGDNDPEQVLLKQRQARADALRRQGMQQQPLGQMAGRVFIPNTSGMVGSALQTIQADRAQPGLDQSTRDVMGRTNDARNVYANKLIEALRRKQPGQPEPQDISGGYESGYGEY